MDLHERLRYHAARLGLDGGQLADKVGVSRSAISRWMNGEYPTFENLQKVVAALGMTMEEFWRPLPEATEAAG